MIAPRIAEAKFLDLCAGSGAVGIEALSRGAAHVTFVDRSRRMCALIESNLALVKVSKSEFSVIHSEAKDFLRRTVSRGAEVWNIVFFDPPYDSDYLQPLSLLAEGADALLAPDGLVISEHHHKAKLPDEIGRLRRFRILKQGDSALSFFHFAEAG